ncbi:hypothetical protein CERZMDRAFT_22795, partial [Cercospora zeae-maydis SCOH1-5]
TLYDVRFWPYGTQDDEHIFALTGGTATFVCRTRRGADPPFELLRHVHDEHATPASLNSLAWTRAPVTNKPWLCVAGDGQHHIKILDFESGTVARTLPGHGSAVNDLAVSPTTPNLLASASNDYTIRLWDLRPAYQAQPCVAVLADGHRAPVLAIKFHPNGRWLISGGIDTAVCLWSIPPLGERAPDSDWSTTSIPLTIQLPHFFTKELHPNYVDSFDFYGDLILSKAARDQADAKKYRYANEILLWRINGFDADESPSERLPVQEAGKYTGSAFPHDEDYR